MHIFMHVEVGRQLLEPSLRSLARTQVVRLLRRELSVLSHFAIFHMALHEI